VVRTVQHHNGEMRVTVVFYDAANTVLAENHSVVHGQKPRVASRDRRFRFHAEEQTSVGASGRDEDACLPGFGGPGATRGVMLIDDLSVAPPPQPAVLEGNFWPNPTFEAART